MYDIFGRKLNKAIGSKQFFFSQLKIIKDFIPKYCIIFSLDILWIGEILNILTIKIILLFFGFSDTNNIVILAFFEII